MKNNILNHVKRFVALTLALVSISIGTIGMPVEASAATKVSNSVSTVKVDTSDDSYYMTNKNNVKLKKGTGALAGTYCTLKKNSIIQVTGTSGSYYKVKLDSTTYYVKKSDLSEAAECRYASLLYTKNSAALHKAPDQDASKTTLSAGTVLLNLGEVTHKGNTWYIVKQGANGSTRFIYSGNVSKASKITLSISGDVTSMMVGDTTKLSYSVDPKVNVTWSSSNTKVATVNMAGTVTGVSEGSCNIKATINGLMSVCYEIKIVGYETQIKNTYSVIKKMANKKTFNGLCGLYAGCTVKALGITTDANTQNGKDQYDVYKNLTKTSGGYKVNAYGAADYSLKSALNAVSNNGKTNVKNILVGFHTGSGADGQKYGHVVFIHAIVDGKVYFSESFSARVAGKTYAEGAPIVCTIDQFASYYGNWTTFEGIIHFYK